MPDRSLRGCRILIVEDEYLLADELQIELEAVEAEVLGPVGKLDDALELVRSERRIDGAILDINLAGDMTFPVADLLIERCVPLIFTTGYEGDIIPKRFENVVCCLKPTSINVVRKAIGRAIHH